MLPALPADVIEFVRAAFAEVNAKVTLLLSRQPSIHEEGLDFHLVSSLDEIGPRLLPTSGAAVEIETHWLGGRRHFGRWEIADIAVVVVVRQSGRLVARKIALLQSKRLYSREVPIQTRDRSDYEIGIGRLIDRTESTVPLFQRRQFSFSNDCVYGALTAGSEQVERIERYFAERNVPVYYTLYNPSRIPLSAAVPRLTTEPEDVSIELGCRVLTAQEAHTVLASLPVGKPPTFSELVREASSGLSRDLYAPHGWRLETFVADEMLQCREGRLFEDTQDPDLESLLYARSAPIAAAVVVNIDLPTELARRRGRRELNI